MTPDGTDMRDNAVIDVADLTITYDGAPVRNGQMDAAVLGNALLALADLLNASNRALNGGRTIINVSVKADFKRGSFGVESVVQMLADTVAPVLPVLPMVAMSDLRTAGEIVKSVFSFGSGLVDAVRKLKGKEIVSTTPVGDTGTVKVEVRDSPNANVTVLNFPKDTMTLYGSAPARLALQRTVAPLELPGMTEVKAEENGRPLNTISAEEVDDFKVPPDLGDESKQIWDDTTDAIYEVVALSFYSGRGWKLSAAGTGGKDPIAVTIEDKRFLDDIAKYKFERGLALKVTLRTIAKKKKDGTIEPKYIVQKVHEVIPLNKPTQSEFPTQG